MLFAQRIFYGAGKTMQRKKLKAETENELLQISQQEHENAGAEINIANELLSHASYETGIASMLEAIAHALLAIHAELALIRANFH